MLSKVNKTKGLPGEGIVSRLAKIAGELGVRGSFAGLPTRLFMVGGLTAGQFAIYGDIKKALGKFFHASPFFCFSKKEKTEKTKQIGVGKTALMIYLLLGATKSVEIAN